MAEHYRERECYDCLGLFPGNELNRKSVSKEMARSVRQADYRDSSQLLDTSRATSHIRNLDIFLCDSCLSKRRLKSLIKWLVIIAIFVIGIAWWQSQNLMNSLDGFQNSKLDSNVLRNGDEAEEGLSDSEFVAGSGAAVPDIGLETEVASNDDEADELQLEETETAIQTQEPVFEVSPVIQISPEESTVLESAIIESVSSGEAVRWTDNDQSGYAVVSEASSNGCRDYYYTVESGSEVWKSGVKTKCPDSN